MADRAYLGVWTREFSEASLLEQLVRFLASVPHSPSEPHFTQLVVQSIDATETPVAEWDLRGQSFGPAEVGALVAQHLHGDTAYFVSTKWDLWQFDVQTLKWQQRPAPLTIVCHGPDYDEGIAATAGHFQADLGFEHLFTGHAGLLTPQALQMATPKACVQPAVIEVPRAEDPVEHTFLRWMAAETNLREYHQKTRENIQHLLDWVAAVERALPVERTELWSEGEENFEARLDQILAKH